MIPEAAVEAALVAIFPKGPISDFSRATWTRTVTAILEAAAPHMVKLALNDALDDLEDIDPDNLRVWLRERADNIRPTP